MNLDDMLDTTAQHVAVMGDPGTGKSTLTGLLAVKYKLIWFSLDGGHKVLKKLPADVRKNINIIHLPDTRAYPVGWTTLNKFLDADSKMHICNRHGAHDCSTCKGNPEATYTDIDTTAISLDTIVVVDHGTQLADSCMNTITKRQPVDYKPQLDDWGSLRFHLAAIGKKIQAAPFNIVMLFQPEESEMDDKRKKLTPGWGSNNSSKTASQYFDHLVYLELLNRSHKAGSSTTYSTMAVAKSRTDVKIEDLKEPSLLPFFSAEVQAAAVVADKKEAAAVLSVDPKPKDIVKDIAAAAVAAANVVELAERKTIEAQVVAKPTITTSEAVLSVKEKLEKLRGKK